jgi:hypothetical protein
MMLTHQRVDGHARPVHAERVIASYLSPKVAVRADAAGWGTYAVEPIMAGETVAAVGGQCVALGAVSTAEPTVRDRAVQIDDDLVIVAADDAAPGHTIGHSCAPNCGMSGAVLVTTMRDVAPGERLTIDDAMFLGSDLREFECHCGAPSCRHKVTGQDWMLPELQFAYRGHFSPYLARRIAALVRTGAERRAFAY